jgi:hypothetical protein
MLRLKTRINFYRCKKMTSLRHHRSKGLRKNELVILVVEAPGRQGVKTQEYLDIPRFVTQPDEMRLPIRSTAYYYG